MYGGAGSWESTTVVLSGSTGSTIFSEDRVVTPLDIVITMHFSINCSIVICLPTVCFLSRAKPLVKTMAPGSIFYQIETEINIEQFTIANHLNKQV